MEETANTADTADLIEVKWVKAYKVDNDKNQIEEVASEGELGEYVDFYMSALRDTRKTAPYRKKSQTGEVLSIITQIAERQQNATNPILAPENELSAINDRFLAKETHAQSRIAHLDTRIKQGCLIHALVKNGNHWCYLIAKLQWNEYLEMTSMSKSTGIAFDNKTLGRSCLITLKPERNHMSICRIEISMDTANTKYFVDGFLEVEPLFDDKKSTEKMTESITNLIDRTFKKNEPRVRLQLKNAFLHEVRSSDHVDYSDIVSNVFERYFFAAGCQVDEKRAEVFLSKLQRLPEEKQFARQFDLVPSAIKQRITSTSYNLKDNIVLTIKSEGSVFDPLNGVVSGVEDDGQTYLKIYTDDREALKTFRQDPTLRH